MNMIVTQNDLNSPILESASFRDEALTFAGADVLLPGTILARSTASQKLIIYVKGGVTDGNGVPKAVLTYQVEATGAGDVQVRAAHAGKMRLEKLVIDADGDATNIDNAVIDQLRAVGFTPIDVDELNIPDNQ